MSEKRNKLDMNLFTELLIFSVIFLGGITCNILVLRGLWLIRTRKSPVRLTSQKNFTNLLIANLAIADLIMLLVSIPTDIVAEYVSWPFGEFVCKYISPVQDVCLNVSALTFAAIAVERYLFSKGRTRRSTRSGKIVISGVWLTSFLTLGVPMALYKEIIVDNGRRECNLIWPNHWVNLVFVSYMIILVLATGITGAVSYCSIRHSLAKIHNMLTGERSDDNNERASNDPLAKQTVKVSKMLSVQLIVHLICALPFPTIIVVTEIAGVTNFEYNYVIYMGASFLLFGNSLANPMIVLLMNKECRSAMFNRKTHTVEPQENMGHDLEEM